MNLFHQRRPVMNTQGAGRIPSIHWRYLYEAAVVELDPQVLRRRIHLARKAIKARVQELVCSGENSETDRLIDALDVLEDLLKTNKAREH